ncbi:MAG: histidine phosphatase family protein [Pirellulales bacterium]
MPDTDTCLLHLIRHAATESNLMKPPRLQGRTVNLPLTEEGRLQARCVAAVLADRALAAIYASGLHRAVETARCIARPHDLEVQCAEELVEVDVGRWEGKQWDEIERDDPEEYHRFMTSPDEYGYPGGESMSDVVRRVAPALEAMMSRHIGCEIAVVAHNVVNRAYIGSLLKIPLAAAREIPQNNGGMNLIRYRAGKIKVLSINAVLHLPPHRVGAPDPAH